MPITQINTVHMSLLGLCFLKDEQRDILKKEWDDRIDTDTALWVDLDPSSSYDQALKTILDAIRAKAGVIAKNQCVMAAFLDFQQEIPAELPETLKRLQETIDLVLNRTTNAILQFGYVGIRGLSNGEAARKNTALFAGENSNRPAAIQHRVCLVASEFTRIGDETNWRAAAVMLDLLRRQNSIVGFLPTSPNGVSNDDVGYLRYAEYDSVTHTTLLQELAKTQQLKGSAGEQTLFQLFDKKRNDMRDLVRQRFAVGENIHPIHPGMKVTGWLNLRKAQKGSNASYNEAADATRKAVSLTCERMKQEIEQLFDQKLPDAREDLTAMFAEAKIGLELKKNKPQMYSILNVTQPGSLPRLPELFYRPEGPSAEIQRYLTDMRNYILDCCIADYEKRVREAYDAIFEKGFVEEEQRLDGELAQIQTRLASLQTPETIFRTIALNNFLPETGLTPVGVTGRQQSYAIFRGTDELRGQIQQLANATAAYEMRPLGDDPESKKIRPVKAVQMMVSDNTEANLRGLINWGL